MAKCDLNIGSLEVETPADVVSSGKRKEFVFTLIATAIWLVVIAAAMVWINRSTSTPGTVGMIPPQWPAQSHIPLAAQQPTLVMFIHPHCPCSRATLGELELLLAECPGQLNVQLVFIKAAGTPEDWTRTRLWRQASAIPSVTVSLDDAGIEAQRFHAETSGQTLLYDAKGFLLFEGGITESRGHSGDNPGRSALLALLKHERSGEMNTPVFGCPLFETQCQEGGTACKR